MPRKKILMAITGNVAPDLVHLDGDMVTDFALRNALTEIEVSNKEKFIPVYLRMLNIHGKQWALPLMPTCEAMHLNKNLLDRYGIGVPQTLEDLVVAFDTVSLSSLQKAREQGLRVRGSGVDSGVNERAEDEHNEVIGHSVMSDVAWLPSWPPWAGRFIPAMFGGSWGDESHITANSPENIRAWTWVQENFARKIPRDKLAAFTEGFKAYQSPDNPFYVGRIGIENNGVWERNLASKFAPKMQVVVAAFPYAVIASEAKHSKNVTDVTFLRSQPQVQNGLLRRYAPRNDKASARDDDDAPTVVSVDALAIPRGAKHPELAQKFAEWLLEAEQVEYLALKQAKFSPLREVSTGFISKHPNPYIGTFIALANSPNAIYFPQLPCVQRYRREIGDAYNSMLRMEVTAREALDKLQQTMDSACFQG